MTFLWDPRVEQGENYLFWGFSWFYFIEEGDAEAVHDPKGKD